MKVCIITPGQPSNNPRFVKEADALTEAGHTVHAVCSDCGLWPSRMDAGLMASRRWTWEYAGGTAVEHPWRRAWTGARHSVARRMLEDGQATDIVERWAMARAAPEIARAASRQAADLYIAHHPSVLAIAIEVAASRHGVVGYDIEDDHAAMHPGGAGPSPVEQLVVRIESEHLKRCAYVTAASDGFAAAYEQRYRIYRPTTILNVFPLADRPYQFRPTGSASEPVRLYWFSQVIGPGRGLEDAIGALGLLRGCRFELHIRGHWLSGYRARLLRLAHDHGVGERTIVDYPPAPPSDMVRLAAACDIGLSLEQPADTSGPHRVSNKVLVYLLAGNAVAATDLPGQRVVVDAAGPGAASYAPGDIASLAGILRRWHDDRRLLDLARRRSWDAATRRYNWDLEKRTFLDVVDCAVHGRAHGARQDCA